MVNKPAPKPIYVFRPAHQDLSNTNKQKQDISTGSINHLEFISLESRDHLSLLTLDNHGWASIWNLDSKRIQSLWQPHPNTESIGGCLWAAPLYPSPKSDPQSHDQLSLLILSQGRDHKLKLNEIENYVETCSISTIARANLKPTMTSPSSNIILVAETSINSITFCKASLLSLRQEKIFKPTSSNHLLVHSIVALPSSITEELVDIFGIQIKHPPQIVKIYQAIPSSNEISKKRERGSVVAVQLYSPSGTKDGAEALIFLVIGYESGEVNVLKNEKFQENGDVGSDWEMVVRFKCHTEPILSLTISKDPVDTWAGIAWSVGADKNIVKYHFSACLVSNSNSSSHLEQSPKSKYEINTKAKVFETNQVGRFDIKVRSDGRVLAIYNWGGKIWLFDPKGSDISETRDSRKIHDGFDPFNFFKLQPIGLLNLPTEPSNRAGVLAFSPFPPPLQIRHSHPHLMDSLVGSALLVASGSAGQVTAWEVFPHQS